MQMKGQITFKKKHLIPICRIKSNDDFNKENIFIHKVPKGKTSLALSNRQFGTDLTNILSKTNNISNNSIQNSLSLRNNSFSRFNDKLKQNFSLKHLIMNNRSKKDILLVKDNLYTLKEGKQIADKNTKLLYKKKQTLKNHFSFHFIPTNSNCSKLSISSSSLTNQGISSRKSLSQTRKSSLSKKKEIIVSKEKDSNIPSGIVSPTAKKNLLPLLLDDYDIQKVPEYCDEIYANLFKEEEAFIASNKLDIYYIKKQKEINAEMRSILVNWIIEVHEKFNYHESTLFLCIMRIDRYLSLHTITRINFQLLGIASLYIACKHEEVNLPNPRDFLFITENAYSYKDLYSMEYDILKAIDFSVLIPTSLDFFQFLSKKYELSKKEDNLGRFLINSILIEYGFIKYPQSMIANAVMIIISHQYKKGFQIEKNQLYYKSEKVNIDKCSKDIIYLINVLNKTEYLAAKNKFSSQKYDSISSIDLKLI